MTTITVRGTATGLAQTNNRTAAGIRTRHALRTMRLAVSRVHLSLNTMHDILCGECTWIGQHRERLLAACELVSEEAAVALHRDYDSAFHEVRRAYCDGLSDALGNLEDLTFKASSVVATMRSMIRMQEFRGDAPAEVVGACHLCVDVIRALWAAVEAAEGLLGGEVAA